MVINYHNNPSQSCDVVTEGALTQPLYHPHSNFLKAKDSDSLILLLVNMYAGLASPSIFLTEIGLEKFLLESMWERNQWYLTEINLLVGVRRGYEATNTEPLLSSKTYDWVTNFIFFVLRPRHLRVSLARALNRIRPLSDCDGATYYMCIVDREISFWSLETHMMGQLENVTTYPYHDLSHTGLQGSS